MRKALVVFNLWARSENVIGQQLFILYIRLIRLFIIQGNLLKINQKENTLFNFTFYVSV